MDIASLLKGLAGLCDRRDWLLVVAVLRAAARKCGLSIAVLVTTIAAILLTVVSAGWSLSA
jgi:hypothetical protein